jgi:hypothetical protein
MTFVASEGRCLPLGVNEAHLPAGTPIVSGYKSIERFLST